MDIKVLEIKTELRNKYKTDNWPYKGITSKTDHMLCDILEELKILNMYIKENKRTK